MADLRIEGADLDAAIERANTVLNDFSQAHTGAHGAAAHVGHAGLADRVTAFADSWDIKRGRLEDRVRLIRDALVAVRDTFEDVDNEIAAQSRAAGSTSGGGGW